MKEDQNGVSRIVFLNAPLSLKEDIRRYLKRIEGPFDSEDSAGGAYDGENGGEEKARPDSFIPDGGIPLPVEVEAGNEPQESGELSWEMIVSAMIKVIASPGEYGLDGPRVDYYRRFVLALKPDIMNELSGAAIIKARNGDFDMALEIITLLESLFPDAPELRLNRALIMEDKAAARKQEENESEDDFIEEVYEAYEHALSTEPILPGTFFNAGYFYLKRGEYGRARDSFADYLSASGGENTGGEKAEKEEKRERARAVIDDIEMRGLDDGDFLDALKLIRSGDDGNALPKIKIFLERRPMIWNGWFVLGWALRRLGRWEDSLESFTKAVELGGGNSDTRNEMAICLMEKGDLSAARRELETALREEPENTKIISNLGVLAMKSGDDDLAARFFRTVLELDPDDEIAGNYFLVR